MWQKENFVLSILWFLVKIICSYVHYAIKNTNFYYKQKTLNRTANITISDMFWDCRFFSCFFMLVLYWLSSTTEVHRQNKWGCMASWVSICVLRSHCFFLVQLLAVDQLGQLFNLTLLQSPHVFSKNEHKASKHINKNDHFW